LCRYVYKLDDFVSACVFDKFFKNIGKTGFDLCFSTVLVKIFYIFYPSNLDNIITIGSDIDLSKYMSNFLNLYTLYTVKNSLSF